MKREMSRRSALLAPLLPLLGTALAATTTSARAQDRSGNRMLVAFLTRSGNTAVIAGYLSRKHAADLFEIRTATPYPADYEAHVEIAQQQRDARTHPELADSVADMARYDTVFLGFPIWGGALPAPVRTFLSTHDLSGKTVVPFVTHGGYGPGSAPQAVAELAPRARLVEPFVLEADQERRTLNLVSDWLGEVDPQL